MFLFKYFAIFTYFLNALTVNAPKQGVVISSPMCVNLSENKFSGGTHERKKITIWEERIHACQNSDLTVAAWCREHQISVATYYYWRKRVSANDEMLSVKEPVFAELTNIRKAALSEEKEPLLISFNQLQLAVSTPAQAELAAVLISRMQSLC